MDECQWPRRVTVKTGLEVEVMMFRNPRPYTYCGREKRTLCWIIEMKEGGRKGVSNFPQVSAMINWIYMHVCVCVCVCVMEKTDRTTCDF